MDPVRLRDDKGEDMDKSSDKPSIEQPKQSEVQEQELIANIDEAVESFSDLPFDDYPEALLSINPSLHPALYRSLLDAKNSYTVGAIENIRSFQGVDIQQALDELLQTKDSHWLLSSIDLYPELDVLKLIDSMIEHGNTTSIKHDIGKIDSSLHDAIARKMIAAGEVLAIFDDYHGGGKFVSLSMEVLKAYYERVMEFSNNERQNHDVFTRNLWEYLGQFGVSHGDIITFLRENGMEQYVKNGISRFNMPFGRENSLWLLEVGNVTTLQRILLGTRHYQPDVTDKEIFDLWWPDPARRSLLAKNLRFFYEYLQEDDLKELIVQGYKKQVGEFLVAMSEDGGDNATGLLERLYDLGLSSVVFEQRGSRFRKGVVDDKGLFDHLVADGEVQTLVNGLLLRSSDSTFERTREERCKILIDPKVAAPQLLDVGMHYVLAARLRLFGDAVDHNDLAKRLLADYDKEIEQKRNPNLSLENTPLMHFFPQFRDLDDEVKMMIIERGGGRKLLDTMNNRRESSFEDQYDPKRAEGSLFGALNQNDVLGALLKSKDFKTIARYVGEFDESFDQNRIVFRMINGGGSTAVIHGLSRFRQLSGDVADRLLGRHGNAGSHIIDNAHVFDNLEPETIVRIIDSAASYGDLLKAVEFNEKHGSPNKVLGRLYKAFGGQFSQMEYERASMLFEGTITNLVADLGVSETGERGVNQFVQHLRALRHKFVVGKFDAKDLDSELKLKWFANVVRYEDSDWGSHDLDSLGCLKSDYFELQENGEIEEMPAEYQPAIVQVGKVDREAIESFEHSEGFMSRYKQLFGSIWRALELRLHDGMHGKDKESSSGLNIILQEIGSKRDSLLEELQEKKFDIAQRVSERGGDPVRAAAGIEKRMQKLTDLDLEKVSHPQDLFNTLREYKGVFDESLRQIMFYFAFHKHKAQRDMDWGTFDEDNPTIEDLSAVMNFVDHITNQETFAEYFTDKRATKNFKGLLNIGALQEEFTRWQEQSAGTSGTRSLQITPQRNLLTEMSGHVGDACWANKIPSILKAHPNFISFTYTVNPGDPQFEKFVGAGFMIETKDKDGTPTLVIRGNNPIESFINQTDAMDFLAESIEHFFEPMAKARGMQLAIVVDYAGGAGTNRPVLQNAYDKLMSKLRRVTLGSNLDTQFNGYDIRNSTYLITSEDVRALIE